MRLTYDECEKLTLMKNVTRLICVHRLSHLSEALLNSSICSGDSGSPLHQQNGCQAVQIGVNSIIMTGRGGCGTTMGLVRVSENTQWIRSEIMNENFVQRDD